MTAPLPGPDGPGASIAGGSSLVVFGTSRVKAAAWQWIEYLSQPDVQRRFHELTGDLPPRRATWTEGQLAEDLYARAFREQLERVKPAPKVPEWERIANELRLVAERAGIGVVGESPLGPSRASRREVPGEVVEPALDIRLREILDPLPRGGLDA